MLRVFRVRVKMIEAYANIELQEFSLGCAANSTIVLLYAMSL
jgi:hypothetical protein